MPPPYTPPPPLPSPAPLPERILHLVETIITILAAVLSLGLFKRKTKHRTAKDRVRPPTTDHTGSADE